MSRQIGVAVEVKITRMETVIIDIDRGVALIERVLEDKAIASAKKAMVEYGETLATPWSIYTAHQKVSMREIVDAMEAGGKSFESMLEAGGLLEWQYVQEWIADRTWTAVQWSHMLNEPIRTPSLEEAMVMWQDAVT